MEHYVLTGSIKSTDAVPHQTKPLSYVASKCVLQHLEANTRILLVALCRSLQNQHMTVPLKIQYLKMETDGVYINDFAHLFFRWVQRRDHPQFVRYFVRFRGDIYPLFYCKAPYEPRNIIQKFMEKFVLKGHTPLVNELHLIWCADNVNFAKFRVNELQFLKRPGQKSITPEDVCSLVDPKSFPVKKLFVEFNNVDDPLFQSDYLAKTDFLELRVPAAGFHVLWDKWQRPLLNLRNKIVKVSLRRSFCTFAGMAEIAQNWIRSPREIGTKYTFEFLSYSSEVLRELSAVIRRFTGVQNKYCQGSYRFKMGEDKELNICKLENMELISNDPFYSDENLHVIVMEICRNDTNMIFK